MKNIRIKDILLLWVIVSITTACSVKKNRALTTSKNFSIELVRIHGGVNERVGPCEPSIEINPNNPDIVAAGSVLDNVYISNDGGRTWDVQKLTSPYGVYGDPVVKFNNKGQAFYAHLSIPDKDYYADSFLDRIVVQRSDDSGVTWSDGTFPATDMTKDQDKHWIYIHPDDRILMTWTEFDKYGSPDTMCRSRILFSESNDDGRTWSPPSRISTQEGNCKDSNQTTEGALPVVAADGSVQVVWAYDGKLLHKSSSDGKSWTEDDRVIATQEGGWDYQVPGLGRCNGLPVFIVDDSPSIHRGNLYLNWTSRANENADAEVWFMKSTDNGKTWSTPKVVNDDKSKRDQFLTWMDVDPVTGYLYVVFYDRRNYDDNRTDVYLAYSKDGGDSFTNLKVTERPFIPSDKVFFGDYNNVSAYNNTVLPVWTEYRNGKLEIWNAVIKMR